MKYWATALSALLLAGTAQAQEASVLGAADPDQVSQAPTQITNRDGELLSSVTFADLWYIASSQGHTIEKEMPERMALMATAENGVRFFLQGTACMTPTSCQGLHIWMGFEGEYSYERANEINYQYAAISAIVKEDGDFQISRYLILDHGQTIANIKSNLLNTLAIAEQIWIASAEEERSASVAAAEAQLASSMLEELPETIELERPSRDDDRSDDVLRLE